MTMQMSVPPGFGVVVYHHSVQGVAHTMSTSHGFSWPSQLVEDAAFELNARFKTGLMNNGTRMANSGTYHGLSAYFTLPNGDIHEEQIPESIGGTQGSSACPPQCALLIDKRTGLAGKAFRGRFFFPSCYLIEGEVTDAGIIASGVMAGHVATCDAWVANLVQSGVAPVLLHQFGTYINRDGETVTVAERAPTPITSFVPSAKIGTQRNRLR